MEENCGGRSAIVKRHKHGTYRLGARGKGAATEGSGGGVAQGLEEDTLVHGHRLGRSRGVRLVLQRKRKVCACD